MNSNFNKYAFSISLLALVASLSLSAYLYISIPKVAYIDTAELMKELTIMQQTKKRVEQEQKIYTARVDTLAMEFQGELKKFEKDMAKMTDKEKKLTGDLLGMKQKQLNDFQQSANQKLAEMDRIYTAEALNKINGFISEYGKAKGYKMIFATSNGNLAYGNEGLNITKQLVEGINNKFR